MSIKEEIIKMQDLEKIHLIDELLLSLDIPTEEIDKSLKDEVEDRIKANDEGKIKIIPSSEIFSKYQK